jgi:PTH1 family peptidyl-tRNA hydrolase
VSSERWLIAGLGNPGTEYAHNRHNVGYWCVNRLARLHGVKLKAKTLAAIGEGAINGVPVVLLKPRTYVNRSGDAVAPSLRKGKIPTDHRIVVYDELDLPRGACIRRRRAGYKCEVDHRVDRQRLSASDRDRATARRWRAMGSRSTWATTSSATPAPASANVRTRWPRGEGSGDDSDRGVEAAMNKYNKG